MAACGEFKKQARRVAMQARRAAQGLAGGDWATRPDHARAARKEGRTHRRQVAADTAVATPRQPPLPLPQHDRVIVVFSNGWFSVASLETVRGAPLKPLLRRLVHSPDVLVALTDVYYTTKKRRCGSDMQLLTMHEAGFLPATHQDAGNKSRYMRCPACVQPDEAGVLLKVNRDDHARGSITLRGWT